MLAKVCETIEKYAMLKDGERVLVCVSAGPDSVALLQVLYRLSMVAPLPPTYRASQPLAQKRRIPEGHGIHQAAGSDTAGAIALEIVDVAKSAEHAGLSIEEAARQARYHFFIDVARRLGIAKIATAHTKDDQAETVLMRLLKGTGLRGLSGIPPIRGAEGCMVIRPFLEVSRKE